MRIGILRDSNKRLLCVSEEQEKMIKTLIEKWSQKTVEVEMMIGGESEAKKSDSEGVSNKTYFRKSKQKR